MAVAILSAFISLAFWHFDKKQGLKMSDLKGLPELKVLDIVLRAGIDLDSLLIQKLSNSPYSHIGVVISTKPLQILHASSSDTQNKVAVSEFSYFLANAKGIAVKRYMNLWGVERSDEVENSKNSGVSQDFESKNAEFKNANNQAILQGTERQNTEFKSSESGKRLDFKSNENQAIERVINHLKSQIGKEFRLFNESEKLYCTTLIESAFNQAFTLNLAYEKLNFSLLSGEYLFPKAFYEDNKSVLIYEFVR